jgi:predicted ArsR family transcriptional regulator
MPISSDDRERERIAPHLNQIPRDLDDMAQRIDSMTGTIREHVKKIVERHEYVRGNGEPARDAIKKLKQALGALDGALDQLEAKF